MTAVSAPGKFVQTWRAPTWPDGHFGQLTATLDQGSGSTTLHIDLEGVPVGKEDETEQGIEVYYIRSLKVRPFPSLPRPPLLCLRGEDETADVPHWLFLRCPLSTNSK